MASILGSSLLNLAATLVSLSAGFFVSVITARVLGPAGSGTVAYAMWLVICASAIADRGLPQMVLRYAAGVQGDAGERWKPMVRQALRLKLPGVALLFLLFVGFGILQWTEGRDTRLLYTATGLLFVAYALAAFSVAASHGRGLFREAAARTAAGSVMQVPLVLIGAALLGPAGALFGMLTRYLPQALYLPKHVDRTVPATQPTLTPDMRRYARSMWTNDMIEVVLLTRIEYLVLGFFVSATDVGYFAAAVVFAGLVGQMTFQLSPALLVGLTARGPEGPSPDAQARTYRNSLRLTALLVMPMGIGGAAIVPQLLPMVFGHAFQPAAQASSLFLLAAVSTGMAVVPWAYLAAREKSNSLLRLTLVSVCVTLVSLLVMVPIAGVLGAAIVRVLSEALMLGLFFYTVHVHDGPRAPWGALARALLAATLTGAAAFAISTAMPGAAGIGLAVLAGVVVFLTAVRLFGLIEADEAALFTQMTNRALPHRMRPLAGRIVGLIAPSPAG